MYDKDRRSLASRFFRYTTQPRFAREAVLLMLLGWTMTMIAGTNPTPDDTAVHMGFVMSIIGGFLAFMGVFAGISKWVAEPAARKIIAEHKNEGLMSHPEFVPRTEWDQKHLDLTQKMSDMAVAVTTLAGRLDNRIDRSRSDDRKKEF